MGDWPADPVMASILAAESRRHAAVLAADRVLAARVLVACPDQIDWPWVAPRDRLAVWRAHAAASEARAAHQAAIAAADRALCAEIEALVAGEGGSGA